MSGIDDALEQAQLEQQQAASNARLYNADGSAKENDYRAPKLPESTFPSGVAVGTELSVNRDGLNAIATNMRGDLSRLQAALQALYDGGSLGSTIGGWPTADGMGNNAGSAYYGISEFLQELNSAYDLVIGFMRQSASNYADAETATSSAARSVGAETTTSSPLGA